MESYFLSSLELTEIFCYIMTKSEEDNSIGTRKNREEKRPSFSDLQVQSKSTDVATLNRFVKICNAKYSKSFSKHIQIDERENRFPRLLYDISLSVYAGYPYIFNQEELTALLHYIGRSIEDYSPIKPKHLSGHIRQLEGTVWNLYFYEDKVEPSIEIFPMRFEKFGKVRINGREDNDKYSGSYKDFDDKRILCELKTIDGRGRDLHMRFYFGDGATPTLILGQYHNVTNVTYSGNFVLVKETVKSYEDMLPKTVSQANTEEYSSINPLIRYYLNDKNYTKLVSPSSITNEDEFKLYLITHKGYIGE